MAARVADTPEAAIVADTEAVIVVDTPEAAIVADTPVGGGTVIVVAMLTAAVMATAVDMATADMAMELARPWQAAPILGTTA